MSGVYNSVGGFLGTSQGPQAPGGQFGNQSLNTLNGLSASINDPETQAALAAYANGSASSSDVTGEFSKAGHGGGANAAGYQNNLNNMLATGATTGSKYATDQVQNNAILGGLFGQGGQLSQAEGKLTDLNNQGFDLKPQDQTLYGQEAGSIARQFGSQGNQTAQDLASRGMSASGAAGAQFSGLAGNQNEMLAGAQQQIAQQRYQDTMQQIGQQQNFISQLGQQGANAISQQYGRQMGGVQNQTGQLQSAAGLQQSANHEQNQYGLQAAQFNVENTPKNVGDFATAGLGQGIQAGMGGAAASMFGGGDTPPKTDPMSTMPMYGSGVGMGAGSGAMSGLGNGGAFAALA